MRILLTASASYVPPRGGATRSNLVWLDHLARAGHECRIVCGPSAPAAELKYHPTISVFPVAEPARRARVLAAQVREFRPDWVLVSSEDLGHSLLREAHLAAPGRVVYLAHTPQFFPFGPASWNPLPDAAALVAQCAGVVVIGRHMAEYIDRELGRPATVIHPPIYGPGPFAHHGRRDRGLLTMINPCAVKGIDIFLRLAGRLPSLEFAFVPGWGTTASDRRALGRVPNIRCLPNTPGIDDLLWQVRLLLMPSLWYEGFGLIAMESMLRGIPVVSSDSGGLKEAKRNTGYVIPVHTIERFRPVFDDLGMPEPEVPFNDIEPWGAAVEELLSEEGAYARESEASRRAALAFVQEIDPAAMERYLLALTPCGAGQATARRGVESLSPEKRALLLQRLHKRSTDR